MTEPARAVAIITREAAEELGLKEGMRGDRDREGDVGDGRAMRLLLAALAAALVAGAGRRRRASARVTVYAASSLTEVFPRIDPRPSYSFAGSNQLAFQIEQGAPADVFASASPSYTQALYRKGLVERPRTFASNALVLAVPRSNPAGLRSVFDLRDKNVRLVVGSAAVPIGEYTRQRAPQARPGGALEGRQPGAGRQEHLGKVALGEADAGLRLRDRRAGRVRQGQARSRFRPGRSRPFATGSPSSARADKAAARAVVRQRAGDTRARAAAPAGRLRPFREAGCVGTAVAALLGARRHPSAFLLLPLVAIFLRGPAGRAARPAG